MAYMTGDEAGEGYSEEDVGCDANREGGVCGVWDTAGEFG